jgi:hypothetical protein
MASWTKDDQARLDGLRGRELAGVLTEPEGVELAALIAQVDAEEAEALAPAMNRLRAKIAAQDQQLAALQASNEELARLLAQQESLAADGRRFLAEFDERRAAILGALARFADGTLRPA